MSKEQTERTKLGPSYDVVGVSTIDDQDYLNDKEMEDTASINVQVIGKVVPEMDASSLGLTPMVPLSAEYLCEVTDPSTVAMRNPDDAGSVSTENMISVAKVAETTASGLQTPHDGQHPKESTARSRREQSKSPHSKTGREVSPKSRTAKLRARMARVQQMKMMHYLQAPQLLPPPVFAFRNIVTRAEADVALGELQRQIGDTT